MKTVSEILDYMWTIAPKEKAESWDNVGHLVGRSGAEVTTVLTALDITAAVIEEAREVGAQLIVSHHPLIWDTYRHVNDSVFQQDKVLRLAENGIAAICMHTNLDEAEDGVDDTLVETLGLTALRHLGDDGVGHVSELSQELPLQDFLAHVKTALQANGLRYCDSGKPVKRIATGCGSCGEYLEAAKNAGCDTFITGDCKYSVFIDAVGMGMNLIDAGHYPTENPIVRKVAGKLRAQFPDLTILESKCICQPDTFYV